MLISTQTLSALSHKCLYNVPLQPAPIPYYWQTTTELLFPVKDKREGQIPQTLPTTIFAETQIMIMNTNENS